ncbi:hypothetical protein HN51_023249 [Arachis hypogaea]|nr:protein FANTASTIC FOUR 2-like [Arachis hypogaea]QHO54664.1 Protein FANTASTIC FOUR [Arachis hypogaea]
MSHSSVSKGLQSCLKPRNVERVLRLKLATQGFKISPKSEWPNNSSKDDSTIASFSKPNSGNISNNNKLDMKMSKEDSSEEGGKCTWSFIESLSNNSHCGNKDEDSVYVLPKSKCSSSSMLSAKSLEMCTENLGCESGSKSKGDEMSLFSLENNSNGFMENSNTSVEVDTNCFEPNKRLNNNKKCGNTFPPPLTSITDFGGLHVRPRRENGRLILEAVTTPSQPYFRAERSEGRLRLSLFESVESNCGDDDGVEEVEEVVEEEEEVETLNNEACVDEEELEKCVGCVEVVDDEIGIPTKFRTPTRCKASGRNRDIFSDAYFEFPTFSLCL